MTNNKLKIYVVSILVIFISCNDNKFFVTSDLAQYNYKKIKMEELVKNFENYHNLKIETTGILKYEFENVALYDDKWSALRNNFNQAFWLDFPTDLINEELLEKINNKRIGIKGSLNINDKGHLNQYSGTIIVDAYSIK